MVDNLLAAIKAITHLPEIEIKKLVAVAQPLSLKRGDAFIREGDVPKKFAFVNAGLFRYFYTNQKGNEFTKGFFPENSFITSYSAMIKEKPSYYTIEALEDSDISIIDYTQWKLLFNNHPCWSSVLIALLEKGYIKKEAREREFLLLDAATRYRSFLDEYPGLEQRIKQHIVASYLGITPESLSRIRKTIYSI
jgi:CRP-like cAMP-binding protein